MAIWSAIPTCLMTAGFGLSTSGSLGAAFLGGGRSSMARNSSALNLESEEGKENAKRVDDDYVYLGGLTAV